MEVFAQELVKDSKMEVSRCWGPGSDSLFLKKTKWESFVLLMVSHDDFLKRTAQQATDVRI